MLANLKVDFTNHPLNVHYTLDMDDTRLATFDTLTGGDVEIQLIRHNVVYESGEYRTILIPGPTSYAPVVLGRGYGNTKSLYNWFVEASLGKTFAARKNVTITLHIRETGQYKPVVSWNLIDAWPIRIAGFDSNQQGVAQMARFSITLISETIERVDP